MTPAQELEMRRFTASMWSLLRYAARMQPHAAIGGSRLQTANLLQRHGFVIVMRARDYGGGHQLTLTSAGHEALAKAKGSKEK
jgi:hypothetical protein